MVPSMNYSAVSGKGGPNEEEVAYQEALNVLYAIAYTIKTSHKSNYAINGFFEHVVLSLEGFSRQENVDGIDYSNKAAFEWNSVIRLPDFVFQRDFDWTVQTASEKKKIDCSCAKFLTMNEDLCV